MARGPRSPSMGEGVEACALEGTDRFHCCKDGRRRGAQACAVQGAADDAAGLPGGRHRRIGASARRLSGNTDDGNPEAYAHAAGNLNQAIPPSEARSFDQAANVPLRLARADVALSPNSIQ